MPPPYPDDQAGPKEPTTPVGPHGRMMDDIWLWNRTHYRDWQPLTAAERATIPNRFPRLHQIMQDRQNDTNDQKTLRSIIRQGVPVWSASGPGPLPEEAKLFCCIIVNPHARQGVPAEAAEFIQFLHHSKPGILNTGVMQAVLEMPNHPNPPLNHRYNLHKNILEMLRGRLPHPNHIGTSEVDHKCGRRFCVNPYHLRWEPSRLTNMRRQFCPGRMVFVNQDGSVRYFGKCLCGRYTKCRFVRVVRWEDGSGDQDGIISQIESQRG